MLLGPANPYRPGLPEVLTLDAADFEFAISPANERAIGQMADWVVFAYLAADCNLAADMFDDLMDMKAVGSSERVHMLALFDGPLLTDSFIARLNPGSSLADDVVLRFNELRTNDHATLTMALRVASAWPARRGLIVLSGHGSGWRGLLVDENQGLAYQRTPGRLVLPGPGADCDARLQACQRRAQDRLNGELTRPGVAPPRYDVLAVDACYMGNIEAVAQIASFADLVVVSEDLMPGQGFAYAEVMNGLAANTAQSPLELATALVDATKSLYGQAKSPRQVTLIALHADRLAPVAAAFVRLVQALDPTDPASLRTIRYALEKAWRFGRTGTVDLKGFVEKLLENPLPPAAAEAAGAVLTALAEMTAAFAGGGDSDTANGLSIYAPPADQFETAYIEASNQLPLSLGIWAWFLGQYYLQTLGAAAPSHPLLQSLQATMEKLIAEGEYTPGR